MAAAITEVTAQTGSEIKALYEAEADTNAFTDADKTKLDALDPEATAMTGADIKAAYEAEADTNAFTDSDKAKLSGIESGATGDMTAAERNTLYESQVNTNKFTNAHLLKVDRITVTQNTNLDTISSDVETLKATSTGMAVVKVNESRELEVSEVTNTLITNYGQSGRVSLLLPNMSETAFFRIFVETPDNSFYFAPPRGKFLVLDGVTFDVNKRILCDDTLGSSAFATCLQHAEGEYIWHIYTSLGTFLETTADPQVISVVESPQWLCPKEEWSYLDTGVDLGTAWRETDFDDSAWAEGMGPLGFGEADIETTLTEGQVTYYFRKTFFVYGASDTITDVDIDTGYDDGMAVFVNGVEIYRVNLPADASCAYDTIATTGTEGGTKYQLTIPTSALVEGKNVIAVEVHNNAATSSDAYFQLTMADNRSMLRKGPYLMLKETGVVTALWQTTDTCTCSIQWGKYPDELCDPISVTENGSGTDDHVFAYDFPSDEPGARYYYLVSENGAQHMGDFIVPPAADATKAKFFAIGDTASWIATHAQVYNGILNEIDADSEFQGFLMHMGDIVGDAKGELFSEDDWDNDIFDDNYRPQIDIMRHLPWAVTRGNHDVTDADEGLSLPMRKYWPHNYQDSVGFYHSFDYGPVHFTVVDMYVDYEIGSAQYDWIVNDLQNTAKKWKIMTWHEPAYTDSGGVHQNNPGAQTSLHPLCVEHGVYLVMLGHHPS